MNTQTRKAALAAALTLAPACAPGEIGGNVENQTEIDGAECLDNAAQYIRNDVEDLVTRVIFYGNQEERRYGVGVDTKPFSLDGDDIDDIICVVTDQFGETYVGSASKNSNYYDFFGIPESHITAPNFELTLQCTESCNAIVPLRDCTQGGFSCDYFPGGPEVVEEMDLTPFSQY